MSPPWTPAMDEISRRILQHQATIDRAHRILRRRYSDLESNEVYSCCLAGAWKALQKQDEGKEAPFGALLWFSALSNCSDLLNWYTSRQKLVSFIEKEIVIFDLDSPEALLEAQQTHDRLDAMGPPLGGLIGEIRKARGISSTEAKRRLKRAREALGMVSTSGTRWTDAEKRSVLNYLGIPTDNRVNPASPGAQLEGKLPGTQSLNVGVATFSI